MFASSIRNKFTDMLDLDMVQYLEDSKNFRYGGKLVLETLVAHPVSNFNTCIVEVSTTHSYNLYHFIAVLQTNEAERPRC